MAYDTTPNALPYTVVGVYPDMLGGDHGDIDPDAGSFVEWVEAESPSLAEAKAILIEPAREEAVIVAVFEGHMVDKLFNKGLASEDVD